MNQASGGAVVLALGSALAGVAAGWVRGRTLRRPAGGRLVGRLVLPLAILPPVVLILLAKLFDSNTLGMLFGMTLIAEALALPFAALFAAGGWIGAALGRQRRAVFFGMAADRLGTLSIRLDRDSVCAGDDTVPHDRRLELDPHLGVAALLDRVGRTGFLASISGGRATWIAEARCGGRTTVLGVIAQQWPGPRLQVPSDDPLAAYFDGPDARLHFRYEAQADPEQVWRGLGRLRAAAAPG